MQLIKPVLLYEIGFWMESSLHRLVNLMKGAYYAYAEKIKYNMSKIDIFITLGVVGCGKGVVYLTSPGRPTEIGLQACYLCSR